MNPGRSCVKTPHDRDVRPTFTPINPSTAVSYLPGLPGKMLNSESRYAYFINRYPTFKPTPGANTRQPLQASQSIGNSPTSVAPRGPNADRPSTPVSLALAEAVI